MNIHTKTPFHHTETCLKSYVCLLLWYFFFVFKTLQTGLQFALQGTELLCAHTS